MAKAQKVLDAFAQAHAQALQDFHTSAAKHFLPGAGDPADRIGAILSSVTRVQQARDLARLTGDDPAARAGLQRATVDHILSRFQGNALAGYTGTEKLKSDQLQSFISRAAPAMQEYMTKAQVDGLQAVAADLQRANLSVDGVRAGGGSDTAQKAALLAEGGFGSNMLGLFKAHGLRSLLTVGGFLKGGPVGSWIGNRAGEVISHLNAAGIQQTGDLVKEAMLNPALARVLLTNATDTTRRNIGNAFAATLGRVAAARAAHAFGGARAP